MTDEEYEEALRLQIEKTSKRNAEERQKFVAKSNRLQEVILNGTQEDLDAFVDELDEFSAGRGEETDATDGPSSPPVS